MSYKDQNVNLRKNLQDAKGLTKGRNMTQKQNINQYAKRQKSKSTNKSNNGPQNLYLKKFLQKKPLLLNNEDNKKNMTLTNICNKRSQPKKQDFSNTLNPQQKAIKQTQNASYFITADISAVLRAINKTKAPNQTLRKADKKTVNMMTQEDIQRLFETQKSSGTKKYSGQKNKENEYRLNQKFKKKSSIEQQIKGRLCKLKLHQCRLPLMTEPDYHSQNKKIEITPPLIQGRKDYAQSIKFLQLEDETQDQLLSGLNNLGLIKLMADPKVDKTLKFKQDFLVGKQIGQGAYASVRIAIFKPHNKKVAIKIYEKKKIKQPQRRKSVRREIKILQNLDHSNIMKIYDVIETNNHVNIIMQYISGISLNSYLKCQPNSKTTEKDARKIFLPIVEALKYIHKQSICHRDIKLENILLDSTLNPKLIDFGFSTCIEKDKKIKLFCGTPSYMAPEIVLKKEYKGELADIWALGVLLYVMLSGTFPFKGYTDKELYQKIATSDYPRLQDISIELSELIQRMLTIDPDRRITASEILQQTWSLGKELNPKRQSKSKQQRSKILNQEIESPRLVERVLNRPSVNNKPKLSELILDVNKKKLSETQQQATLKYNINLANDFEWSPKMSKPKTCTNRQQNRGKIEENKSSAKILELLKKEIQRKETVNQLKLTNKRYF